MSSLLTTIYGLAITWIGLIMFISIIIFIVCLYRLCIEDSSSWLDKSYRNLTMASITLFCCCIIFDFIHILVRYLKYPTRFEIEGGEEAIAAIADIFYFLSSIVFYSLLFTRISAVFGLNKMTRSLLIFLIFLLALLSIIFIIAIITVLNNRSKFVYLALIDAAISITDFVLNVTLFVIFYRKLRYSIIGEVLTKDYQIKVNLITNILTKHCVLFGIAIIANQFFFIYIIIHWLHVNEHTVISDRIIPFVIRSSESFINITVLCLVLQIYYKQYISLCKYCHLCVGRCCMKNEETMIDNPYYKLTTEL